MRPAFAPGPPGVTEVTEMRPVPGTRSQTPPMPPRGRSRAFADPAENREARRVRKLVQTKRLNLI
jgi:hypothetical protein